MSAAQSIFKLFSSAKTFAKAMEESKQWMYQCSCGKSFSVFDIGGIRYKASGNPTQLVKCPHCGKTEMRKVEKKI